MIGLSQCMFCIRFYFDDFTKNACEAFPEGIPGDVFLSLILHDKSLPGDNGLVFKQNQKMEVWKYKK